MVFSLSRKLSAFQNLFINKNDRQTANNYIEWYASKFLAYRFIDPRYNQMNNEITHSYAKVSFILGIQQKAFENTTEQTKWMNETTKRIFRLCVSCRENVDTKKNESIHKENVGKPNAFMFSSTIHTQLTESVINFSMFNVWQKTKLTLCLCCEMKLKHCYFFFFITCRNLKCLQAYADFSSFTISIFCAFYVFFTLCYNVFCDIV